MSMRFYSKQPASLHRGAERSLSPSQGWQGGEGSCPRRNPAAAWAVCLAEPLVSASTSGRFVAGCHLLALREQKPRYTQHCGEMWMRNQMFPP